MKPIFVKLFIMQNIKRRLQNVNYCPASALVNGQTTYKFVFNIIAMHLIFMLLVDSSFNIIYQNSVRNYEA